MFLIDPWLYYRVNEDEDYWLDGTYVSAGLIKNLDYDAAVIGSSYFQDFRMRWFRDYLDVEPINLTMPGLDNNETLALNKSLIMAGKVKQVYICFTPYSFSSSSEKGRIPLYLLDDNARNDVQYLYSYEAWSKFLPLDVATWVLNKMGAHYLDRYASMFDLDALGNENNRYVYDSKIVWDQISDSNPLEEITPENKTVLYGKLTTNFDKYLDALNLEPSSQIHYYFILPPHSALFWRKSIVEGEYDIYLSFLQHVAARFESFPNVSFIDCQTMDEITNLDHYRDTTHFDLEVQEKIVARLADTQYTITSESIGRQQARLTQLIDVFFKNNEALLKEKGLA